MAGAIVCTLSAIVIFLLLRPLSQRSQRSRLTFDPEDLGGYTNRGLVLSSALCLYLELLLIRWISSEIRIFAYFKNFVLIACFLGFGLGCYLARRGISILALCVPVVAFSIAIAAPLAPLRRLIDTLPLLLGASSEVYIWSSGETSITGSAFSGLLIAAMIALPLFVLIAITFIPLGQLVGWYLESAPRGITAYSLNILASLVGICLFTALCFLNQPPVVWIVGAGALAAALFWQPRVARWIVLGSFLLAAGLVTLQDTAGARVYWSPYQKLAVRPTTMNGRVVGYSLETNGSWYQDVINLSAEFVRAHPKAFGSLPIDLNAYNIPYKFVPRPRKILVLGSGMGNDVAAALRNGAESITAVEIDPLIIALGRKLHPEHPYASSRVHVIIDDARSYLQNSTAKYDLIVFSLLDSHTNASHFTNIRIDNYVYTREAFAAAKRLLKANGVFIVKFQVEQRPWVAGRLYDLLTESFGGEPLQIEAIVGNRSWGRFLVSGSKDRIITSLRDPAFRAYVRARVGMPIEHTTITTDDWPYFYQREPGLPASVVALSLLLITISFVAAERIGLGPRSLRIEFFFLGAAFMLLEAHIISRTALLFGTTWLVNSIVIAVLLLLIVAANGAAAAFPRVNIDAMYLTIVACLGAIYVIPIQALFFRSVVARATVATLILCLPIFFAGIVFIRRFAAAGFSAEAIGSNLLGALAGGIAESLSLWIGFRAILGIVAVLYLAAWMRYRGRYGRGPAATENASSSVVEAAR